MVKVLLHHRGDHRGQGRLLVDGEHRGAHDLRDELRDVPSLANNFGPKVGIGHDTHRPPACVDDQNGADVALAHHRGGVADGRLAVASQDIAHGVHTAHVITGLRSALVTPRLPHRNEPIGLSKPRNVAREVRRKEHRHPGRFGYQLVELILRENIKQGVVFRLRGRSVGSISEKRSNAEDVAVVADIDENVLAVDPLSHLNFAFD